jgi:hypothetical protein
LGAHRAVVGVQDLGLGAEAFELVVDGLDPLDPLADDIPRGRRGDGRIQIGLEPLEAVKGHAGAAVKQGDQAAGGLVVLFSLRLGRGRVEIQSRHQLIMGLESL